MFRARKIINANIQNISCDNVAVAILDTGVNNHPDIKDNIIVFQDFVDNRVSLLDQNGHGTHVCGILSGRGLLSGGKYCGVAPGTKIVMCRILDGMGNGSSEQLIDAIDWIIRYKEYFKIKILNISVGYDDSYKRKEKEIIDAIKHAWDVGLLVVIASGNGGPASDSISSIANIYECVTVGCYDMNVPDRCKNYSGRGQKNSMNRKPDLVAPGTDIISCNNNWKSKSGKINPSYIARSGTSMAVPMVSGAAAIVYSNDNDITNKEVKQRLTFSAADLGEPWNLQGWGMLDVGHLTDN